MMRTLPCALLLAAVAAAQSFETLLPDSTAFFVSVENVARTKERWGKCRLAALLEDEAMQPFLEKPRESWKESMAQLEKEGFFSPEEVLDVLSGQAVFAGVWPAEAKEPEPLLIADIGENSERLRELVAKIEKRLVDEKGNRRDEEEFRGVKIVHYTAKDSEDAEAGAWFIDGKTFAMTSRAEALKDMLARKDRDGEGTLATRDLYRRIRGRLGARSADVFAYVDGQNILGAVQGAGIASEFTMKMLGALGITSIEGLAAEFVLEPKDIALRAFVAVKGEKRGVLKLLDGKNSALLPPRYVPADALTAGAFTLDTAAFWEEVRRTMDRMEQGASERMDQQFAMLKQQLGVDIPGDIIASLGNEIAYHTLPPLKQEGEPDAATAMTALGLGRFVVSLQIKNRERFEGALEKLLNVFGLMPATQDYLGVKLRKIPTAWGIMPTFAVLPDRVLFSLKTDDVKDVITRYGKETKGFVDREDMAAAAAALPPQRFAITVDDMPKSLAAASSSLAAAMSLVRAGDSGFAGSLDMSAFPSADVLGKYIGLNTGCMVNEEDGVSYVSMIHFVGE